MEDKPTLSTALHTEASKTNSLCDKILKKYGDTLPLTERQLVKYLRKVSRVLFERIIEDQQEKHKEAVVHYVHLKVFIDDYNENIAHRDQTDKLVEASMSSLEKRSTTINDLYKDLEVITHILKDITNSVKDDPATNKKIEEAFETLSKIFIQTTKIISSARIFDFSTLYVTPTFALIDILANVEGENTTHTAAKEPHSHTEGKTDANIQEKPKESKQSINENIEFIGSAFGISELDELREIIQKKKNVMVKDLMNSLSRRKQKHMELEPETRIPGLECNQALPENVSFVNNMVIKEPEYGIFFTDKFGDQAF
uniref:Copia protein n=1 Tax=Tanacetum cinerariifolium TaxID=118510 RepID=A0A699KAT4_TANCI|nr:copia protein [Tanacetum cinerariifolium]